MAKFEATRAGQYAAPYGVSADLVGAAIGTTTAVTTAAVGAGLSVKSARIGAQKVAPPKAPPPVVEKPLSAGLQQKSRKAAWWNVGGIALAVAAVGAAFWFTRKK